MVMGGFRLFAVNIYLGIGSNLVSIFFVFRVASRYFDDQV